VASPTEKHKGFPAGPPELGLSTRWRRAGGLSLWLVLPLGLPSALRAQSVTITEYPLPVASSATPGGISAGPDGALWFTEVGGNKIGRITMSGMITEYPVPTAASNPTAITNGPDGGAVVYRVQ
jgi:streptogramin lyase